MPVDESPSLQKLTERIVAFREARDWKQFHLTKNMVISLFLEVAELAEHFQWRSEEEIQEYLSTNREAVGKELADVLYWVLLISHDLGVNLGQTFAAKMNENEEKYPADAARGKATKYDKLDAGE